MRKAHNDLQGRLRLYRTNVSERRFVSEPFQWSTCSKALGIAAPPRTSVGAEVLSRLVSECVDESSASEDVLRGILQSLTPLQASVVSRCRSTAAVMECILRLTHVAEFLQMISLFSNNVLRRRFVPGLIGLADMQVQTITLLHASVVHGDLAPLQALLQRNMCIVSNEECTMGSAVTLSAYHTKCAEVNGSALHWAAAGRYYDALRILCEYIQQRDYSRGCPCCESNVDQQRKGECLHWLVDTWLRTPLHYACEIGWVEGMELLLALPFPAMAAADRYGDTPMHVAAKAGKSKAIRAMVRAGASPDAQNVNGLTPLHMAVCSSDDGAVRCVKTLIECGARLLPDASGRDPFAVAVFEGRSKVLETMLQSGIELSSSAIAVFVKYAIQSAPVEVAQLLLRKCDIRLHRSDHLLHRVLERNDNTLLRAVLDAGASVNSLDGEGNCPLHLAVEGGNLDGVRLLLDYGADATVTTAEGLRAIHLACIYGDTQVLHHLVQRGVHVESVSPNGMRPLHFASGQGHSECVAILLEAGADACATTHSGETPLHFACGISEGVIRELVRRGASVRAVDASGSTPLHTMAQGWMSNECSVGEVIRLGGDVMARDGAGMTPLEVAACGCSPLEVTVCLASNYCDCPVVRDAIRAALECKNTAKALALFGIGKMGVDDALDDMDRTALHYASMTANLEGTELLIAHGACVSSRDKHGQTPLHLCSSSHEIASTLLRSGASCSAADHGGVQPLHSLCVVGDAPVISMLSALDLCLDAQDANGATALHYAASTGNLPVVKWLLANEVDCAIATKQGWTAFHVAAAVENGGAVVEMLLNYLPRRCLNSPTGDVDAPAPIPTFGKGLTALQMACKRGDVKMVKLLISAGVDPNGRNREKVSPLNVAVCGPLPHAHDVVAVLIEAGADINNGGSLPTPLSLAVASRRRVFIDQLCDAGADLTADRHLLHNAVNTGDVAIVQELLRRGVDTEIADEGGWTPLHLAAAKSEQLVCMLLEHGASPFVTSKLGATPNLVAFLFLSVEVERDAVLKLLLDAQGRDTAIPDMTNMIDEMVTGDVGRALASNACTLVATGSQYQLQPMYECYTCGLTEGIACCMSCARVCHATHDLSSLKISVHGFYCDCGLRKCRAYNGRSARKQMENSEQ